MLSTLTRKIRGAYNHGIYLHSETSRKKGNRAIARVVEAVPTGHDGMILCDGLWDHPHHWLRAAIFRRAAAKHFGSELVGLYEESTPPKVISSLRSLGLTAEEIVPESVPSKCTRQARDMLKDVQTPRQILEMTFPDNYPAHYFYDGVLKSNQIGQVNGAHPALSGHLGKALHYLDFYDKLLNRHDIRAVLVSHPTNIRFSTLVWTALKRSIPVFVMNYTNQHITIRKMVRKDEFIGAVIDYPSPRERDSFCPEEREKLIQWGREFLEAQRTGREGQISMVGVYGNGNLQYAQRSDFCRKFGGNPDKPNIVIMGNCFPDFPNIYGPSYFTDYVDWLNVTLDAIKNNRDCNWILKPHPAEHLYGKNVTLRTLIGDSLPENLFYWPEDMSGIEIAAYADCIVTANGTSAIEYSAFGKRTLVSRECPYTPWEFVNFTRSKQDYIQALQNISTLPLPSDRQREDAQIYAALSLAGPLDKKALRFPWGLKSFLLWPGLSDFINDNQDGIQNEVDTISEWLDSGNHCYNVYRSIAAARS